MLCSALLQPRLDYGCNVWYRSLEQSLKTKLQTAQNKMIRFVLGKNSRFHVGYKEFKNLNWLNVTRRVDYFTYLLMFNISCGTAPDYMSSLFKSKNSIQCITRRNQKSFVLPHVKSRERQGFRFNGVRLWNNLPGFMKDIVCRNSFKNKVKTFLMHEMGALEKDSFVYL